MAKNKATETNEVELKPEVAEALKGVSWVDPETPAKIAALNMQALQALDLGSLITHFEVHPADAANIKGQIQAAPATVSIEAQMEAAMNGPTTSRLGKWEGRQRHGGAYDQVGSVSFDASLMRELGKSAYGLLTYGGGIVQASLDFSQRVTKGDVDLRDFLAVQRQITEYYDGYSQNQWIKVTPADAQNATELLVPVLTDDVSTMIEALANIGSTTSWQAMLGEGANIPISTGKLSPDDLKNLIGVNAQHVRRSLSNSVIITTDKMMKDIGRAVEVFALPGLHEFYRLPYDANNPHAQVGELLFKAGYNEVSDWFRLASAWNRFAEDWAAVLEASGVNVENDDLFMLTVAAGEVKRTSMSVKVEGGQPLSASNFRNTNVPTVSSAEPRIEQGNRFFSFVANLKISFSASVGR